MAEYQEGWTLKILSSIEKSFERLNKNLAEALARLDEATARISGLNEIHIKLAKTIMKVLNIPEQEELPTDFLPAPPGAIWSAERAETLANGFLRPIVRSLQKPCGEIAKAVTVSRDEILEATRNFDTYEMDVLAKQLNKEPDRLLDTEEQEAYRRKIKSWTQQLRDTLEQF
nr:hypothetical protein [Candidatus Njordarchaeum guaymaensis]